MTLDTGRWMVYDRNRFYMEEDTYANIEIK